MGLRESPIIADGVDHGGSRAAKNTSDIDQLVLRLHSNKIAYLLHGMALLRPQGHESEALYLFNYQCKYASQRQSEIQGGTENAG